MTKYRFNPFTNKLDDSGAIVGKHPAILNVADAQELGEFFENTNRPAYTDASVGSTIYVDTAGSDVTGDGTVGSPFASIQKATQLIGWSDNSLRTIQLGAGTFTLPNSIAGLNNVTIQGTQTITETRNISSPVTTLREGVVFTVDGATLTNDEWRDRHLQYSSTRNIVVTRNIGNVIYGIIYRTNSVSDLQFDISGTVGLIEFTTLQTPSAVDANINLCSGLTFKFLKLTSQSSRDILIKGNPGVNFWGCQWEVRRPVIEDSTVNYWSGSFTGGGQDGMLYIGARSTVSIGAGMVFSDRLAGFNGCWINNSFGSTLQHNGLLFFRGLDATGIRTDAGKVEDISGLSSLISGKVIFDDYAATCSGFYDFNSQTTGVDSVSIMPEMTGQTTANYITEARNGAFIIHNSASDVATGLGTMTVSATAGANNAPYNVQDNTIIIGGSPVYIPPHRTYYNPLQPTTLYLNNSTGSDENDGLTSGTAVASIEKVIQLCQQVYGATQVTVNVANTGTKYVVPFGITDVKNVRFLGEQIVEETRNVAVPSTSSNTTGIVMQIDGLQIPDDEWAGRILHITNTLSNTRNVIVARNTWNGTRNVIYGAMHNRNFLNDTQSVVGSSGDVNLLSLPEFEFPANSVISNCIDVNFEYLKLTGGNVFVNGAAKPQVIRCQSELTSFVGGLAGSAAYILSSSIAHKGTATNGIIASRTKGTVRLGYGNVYIDTKLASPSNMFLNCAEDSAFEWEGGGIFRGLVGNGITFNGAKSSPVSATGLKLIFENQTGTATCAKAFSINSANSVTGNFYGIPECHGEVTGNFFLSALLNARVKVNINTSVATATTTNAVTANLSGAAAAMGPDGTIITGAYPSSSADWGSPLSTATNTTIDPEITGLYLGNTNTSDVTATMPLTTDFTNGTIVTLRNIGTSNNVLIIVPTSTDTIDGASSLVLRDGQSVTLQSYNGDWLLVGENRKTVLFNGTTAVGNVGAGEDDLITYTMPANTLYDDGDYIEVTTCGTVNGTNTFKLYLGSTAILSHTFSGAGSKDFKVTATIIKDGTGSQKVITNLVDGGGSNIDTEYTDTSEDETTNLVIKGTGEGTSNDDVVQEFMIVKWYPKV